MSTFPLNGLVISEITPPPVDREPTWINALDLHSHADYLNLVDTLELFANRGQPYKRLVLSISNGMPHNVLDAGIMITGPNSVMKKALRSTRFWLDVYIRFTEAWKMGDTSTWDVGAMPNIERLALTFPPHLLPGKTSPTFLDLSQSVNLKQIYLCGELVMWWNFRRQQFLNLTTAEFTFHGEDTSIFPTPIGTFEFLKCTPNLEELTLRMDTVWRYSIPDDETHVVLPRLRSFTIDCAGEKQRKITNVLAHIGFPVLETLRIFNSAPSLADPTRELNPKRDCLRLGEFKFIERSWGRKNSTTLKRIEIASEGLYDVDLMMLINFSSQLRVLRLAGAQMTPHALGYFNMTTPLAEGPAVVICKFLERIELVNVNVGTTEKDMKRVQEFLALRWTQKPRRLQEVALYGCGVTDALKSHPPTVKMVTEGFGLHVGEESYAGWTQTG